MTKHDKFDHVSRMLAGEISRRQALKFVLGGFASTLLASVGFSGLAYAGTVAAGSCIAPLPIFSCGSVVMGTGGICNDQMGRQGCCATPGFVGCPFAGASRLCCPSGAICCGNNCCTNGFSCIKPDNICCPPGQIAVNKRCCAPARACKTEKNNPVCCPRDCTSGICCPAGSSKLIGGKCCPENAKVVCGTDCCDGDCFMSNTLCCETPQVVVDDNCCPSGTTVTCGTDCCSGSENACTTDGSACCTTASTGRVSAIRSGPPTQADITIQSSAKGLAALSVFKAVNCRVDMPAFTWGTKQPVICTATKIDQSKPAQFVVMATDTAGCKKPCDPVVTTLEIDKGRWVRQTFDDIPQAEGFVSIQNNAPGLRRVVVEVNGKRFRVWHLKHNELRLLDVASAMQAKDNVITLTGYGKPGASATVLIADVPTETMTTDMQEASPTRARRVAGHAMPNMAWGKMMREERG